jgi:hypothetical protein|tara:strand:- start:572 stop:826 length:255 start_codon:yes stop_codon:yes gene_type:complete
MVDSSLFFKAKNKRLADLVDITSPTAFRRGIEKAKVDGISTSEFKALNLGKTRAKLQLRRDNLSSKERKQFETISKIKIPKITS